MQILTLEDSEDPQDIQRGETFRREGGAEILQLDQQISQASTGSDVVEEELQLTRGRLEVLDEAEEENEADQQTTHPVSPDDEASTVSPADEELIRSELDSMDSNANEMQIAG